MKQIRFVPLIEVSTFILLRLSQYILWVILFTSITE